MGKQPTRPALSQGDEEFLILCASRYCIGRGTSASWLFVQLVNRRFDHLTDGCLCGILRDIKEAMPDGLGTGLTAGEWLRLRTKIEKRVGHGI